MRLLSICFLACLLGCVYWLGATIYSDKIEEDITGRSTAALAKYSPNAAVAVDGRDVTVTASVETDQAKDALIQVADNVWGVRKTQSNIAVAAKQVAPAPAVVLPGFDFSGNYNNGRLHLSGFVDSDDVISKVDQIPAALPPSTIITLGTLTTGAADLINGPEKVET